MTNIGIKPHKMREYCVSQVNGCWTAPAFTKTFDFMEKRLLPSLTKVILLLYYGEEMILGPTTKDEGSRSHSVWGLVVRRISIINNMI